MEASEALFLEGGCLDDASLDLAPRLFATRDLLRGVSSHCGREASLTPKPHAKQAAAEAADLRALLPHGQPQDDGAEQGPVWGCNRAARHQSIARSCVVALIRRRIESVLSLARSQRNSLRRASSSRMRLARMSGAGAHA